MKKLSSAKAALLGTTLAFLGTGCFHTARVRERLDGELASHSQALTTAVADTLALQPPDERDPHSDLALQLAREDQRIEGLPARPIPVANLLTNHPGAEKDLSERFARVRSLLEARRRAEARLIADGAAWQEQQRARARWWTKWIGGSSLLIGGIVTLCVFFPVCVPVLGRILAWVAGKLPALASSLGVVSVKAFDAVVRGIERARQAHPGLERLHNDREAAPTPYAAYAGWSPAAELEAHLAREMDAEHKALVRARKAALKL